MTQAVTAILHMLMHPYGGISDWFENLDLYRMVPAYQKASN